MIAIQIILIFYLATFVHELGHYLAGILRHEHATNFIVGQSFLSKDLFTFNGTTFSLGMIPFGGSVSFDKAAEEMPFKNRCLTLVGGPVANIFFAVVLTLIAGLPLATLVSVPVAALDYFVSLPRVTFAFLIEGKDLYIPVFNFVSALILINMCTGILNLIVALPWSDGGRLLLALFEHQKTIAGKLAVIVLHIVVTAVVIFYVPVMSILDMWSYLRVLLKQ